MMNLKLLKQLYKINSKSGNETQIIDFIVTFIKSHYPNVEVEVDSIGNIYLTKGKSDTYPVIVAHTDQVGTYKDNITIFRSEGIIIGIGEDGKQVNLGADDKNGIWIALELLRTEPVLKVAFFPGEEIGCVGSKACNMDFFNNARFVIQCDRRNGSDFIHTAGGTNLCDLSFPSNELKTKYGYHNTTGLMTDVQTLKKRGLSVACCNISCGYYNPHTTSEYTDVGELINCLHFVREIVQTVGYTPHEYKPYISTYPVNTGSQAQLSFDWDDSLEDDYYNWYERYYKRY